MKKLVLRLRDYLEATWLKRWYVAPRMKATRLDLRLDLSMAGKGVRADAELSFRPQASSKRMVCGLGDARIVSVTWKGRPVKARVNAPYLVLKFPEKLEGFVETSIRIRYTYQPDPYGTIRQPLTPGEFPMRVWLTCRRPMLALTQGELVEGSENPPLRTFEWQPPRCRKLNALVADVRSFRKDGADGTKFWLHVHGDAAERAPRLLDLVIEIYEESAKAHRQSPGHRHVHVFEADTRDQPAFDSSGLIVVPRGSLSSPDRAVVYGVLAPEINKEWGREALLLRATGTKD